MATANTELGASPDRRSVLGGGAPTISSNLELGWVSEPAIEYTFYLYFFTQSSQLTRRGWHSFSLQMLLILNPRKAFKIIFLRGYLSRLLSYIGVFVTFLSRRKD